MDFVRYQAATANRRGTHPGVFALCNGLARDGRLSAVDRCWWRRSNDAMQRAYTDPATVSPHVFDRALHPEVSCWFTASATPLLDSVEGYLDLLDRYAVGWVRLVSQQPGLVLYEDDDQVVVAPLRG